MKPPRITSVQADWDAAITGLANLDGLNQGALATAPDTIKAGPKFAPLARLNAATAEQFPAIAASPVPVLLPMEIDRFLRDKAAGVAGDMERGEYFSGFRPSKFFLTGPAGYDAVFTLRSSDLPALGVKFNKDVDVHISGLAFLYELPEAVGAEVKPNPALQSEFPEMRRIYLESHMRYLFSRYGVLYSVSIECFEGSYYAKRRLSCVDAHPIAVRFLRALTVVGGMPQPANSPGQQQAITRPAQQAPDFVYYRPGQLVPGTSFRRAGGEDDYTVYGTMRFPLAQAPALTYSQMFMDLRDCSQPGIGKRTVRRSGAPFPCPRNNKVAEVEAPPAPAFRYPWRDSFCETRGFLVGQCPAGRGHQGQDIVPVDCRLSSRDTDHCERVQHEVVAVHDGVVLRSPGQEGLILVVNTQNEHIRFRYLHMNPSMIDEGGFFSGRAVREGETVGQVGNYSGREGGTSYHLHFDMHVPTKDGWVLVNPYMTLVASYEKLIGGRGHELAAVPEASAVAPEAATAPHEASSRPKTVRTNSKNVPVRKKTSTLAQTTRNCSSPAGC